MTGALSSRPPSAKIMYLIHHIFLPPKLPRGDDFNLKSEIFLLDTIIESLLRFRSCVTSDQHVIVDSVHDTINNLRSVHDSGILGAVSERELEKALKDLCRKGKHMLNNAHPIIYSG